MHFEVSDTALPCQAKIERRDTGLTHIDAYLKPASGTTDGCVELAKDMRHIVIDGHPARETTKCSAQAGFVAIGSQMYVFSISNRDEVPFLEAYLSTVVLPS
jgi:hypothetical protein